MHCWNLEGLPAAVISGAAAAAAGRAADAVVALLRQAGGDCIT